MSIYTYKNKNEGNTTENTTPINSEEAKEIRDLCDDKFKAPFNESNKYLKGYMYKVEYLDKFYNKN